MNSINIAFRDELVNSNRIIYAWVKGCKEISLSIYPSRMINGVQFRFDWKGHHFTYDVPEIILMRMPFKAFMLNMADTVENVAKEWVVYEKKFINRTALHIIQE